MSRPEEATTASASGARALTRGEAIAACGALGGGLAAALVGPGSTARAATETEREIAVLQRLVQHERSTASAYQTAVDRRALKGLAGGGPELLRQQELAHIDALSDALEQLGGDAAVPGTPPPPSPPPRRAGESELAAWIIDLENAALAAYLDAHRRLRGGGLLAILTSIMANEGQHLAMLRLAMNREPVPRAFETGAPERPAGPNP
jgi:hypothetical protein